MLIIFFEIFYLLKGYKGFRFNFSKNSLMTDNIPCPYYFLFKIKKDLNQNSFFKLIDFGCGSGRIINFFDNTFKDKKFVGIEYFETQFKYCTKIFSNKKSIEIVKGDFTKIDHLTHNADCFFISAPLKNNSDFINFMNNLIKSSLKKKILFIIVNYEKNIIENLKNLTCIKSFYISNTSGYSICYNNNY